MQRIFLRIFWLTPPVGAVALAVLLVGGSRLWGQETKPHDKPFLVLNTGGHSGFIFNAVFSPDGKELITVSLDKTIRVWDVQTGRSRRVLRTPIGAGHNGELNAVDLSPDGKILAVGGFGFAGKGKHPSPIYLIDFASGEITSVLHGHERVITTLAFSADGKYLASGGEDTKILIWDVQTGKAVKSLRGHTDAITSLAFSPDGQKLVSAGSPPHVRDITPDRVAWVWSVATEKVLSKLQGVHSRRVQCVAWSADGKYIATASRVDPGDNFAVLWSGEGKFIKKIAYFANRLMGCESVAFTPDSKEIVLALRDGFYVNAGVYPIAGGESRMLFKGNFQNEEVPAGAAVVPRQGARVAVINDRHHRIAVYNRKSGQFERVLGGVGQQPVLVSWVRTGEPGQRQIAWRNRLVGQAYKAWEAMPGGLFARAFRLNDLELMPAPAGKEERYVRTRYVDGPLWLYGAGGPSVSLKRDNKEIAQLRPPGTSWTTATAVSFLNADQAVVANLSGMYLYDTSPQGNGKLVRGFSGPNGSVLSVSPSPDKGRYLLASADDQVIRIWDPQRSTPLLSFFVVGNDWIVWTQEGYYAATPGAERLMGWQINNGAEKMATFYPADRFRKQLYRPDVIKLVLEMGSVTAALKKADAAAGKETRAAKVEDLLPPRARLRVLDQSKLPLVKLQVQAEASGKDQPITALRLLMDGRPVPGKGTLTEFQAGQAKVEVEWTFELPEGEHQLAVLARSPDSTSISPAVRLKHVDVQKIPVLHVLTIGINKYKDQALDLRFAAPDAEVLAQTFAAQCKGQPFRAVMTSTLLNNKATTPAILKELTEMRKRVNQQDLVVVFFACHGVKHKKDYFLLTHEADVEQLATTALTGGQLRESLAEFKCQVLLLLDACHSGGIGQKQKLAKLGLKPATDDMTRDLTEDEYGVAVMCAAMANEKAEGHDGHGLFTRGILNALEKKPGVPFNTFNQRMYVHHLHAYVFDLVSHQSEERQHPCLNMPWIVESFVVR